MDILFTDIYGNRKAGLASSNGLPLSGLRSLVRRPQPTACGLRSGFTLIELLVVMVVAAIIMTVSLPSFINMGRGAGMRTAVNNVRSTVALSRQWAITHREEVMFVASSTGMSYNATNIPPFSKTTNDHACYYVISVVNNDLIQRITDLPLDVTFGDPTESATNLTFKTDGGLDGIVTAPSDVVLVDKKNPAIKKTISITRLTGGIRVE